MPKQKSHSGAKKRFKITKGGAVTFNKSGRTHFLTKKSSSYNRKKRKRGEIQGKHAKNIKNMIQC